MKKLNLFYITGLLFLISTITIEAQTIKILDQQTQQPVSLVSIQSKQNNGTISSVKGEADLSIFKPSDTLLFKHLAYQNTYVTKADLSKRNYVIYLAPSIIELQQVVLTANKISEKKDDIAQQISILDSKTINRLDVQTPSELLMNTGAAFVQSSQMGGGSPVLRGFEANKVLLVVDGIRMNNAIYRAGHLQNIITIDPNVLERTEIAYGPGSVVYGSDAIGGVVQFLTLTPEYSTNGEAFINGNAMTRYASANNEKTIHTHLKYGVKNWAFVSSATYKDLGDLRAGAWRNQAYGDWGKRLFYTERINGVDSMMVNDNPAIQKNTGYHQLDLLQKINYRASDRTEFGLNLQYSTSGDIPRYDRLQEINSSTGKFKNAEWYYGPQDRLLAALSVKLTNRKLFDYSNITIAWQNISEDRIDRKFGSSKKRHQEETVNVGSLNADFMKQIGSSNELRYGIEAIYNHIGSKAYNENIKTGELKDDVATRYPDKDNNTTALAAYATHSWEITPDFIFSQGVRISHHTLKSEYTTRMMQITKFPFDSVVEQNNLTVNGSLGLVYMFNYGWRIAFSSSTGYRSPNVDDIGKVNDSKAGSVLVIPNPDLKSEKSWNNEITLSKAFDETVKIELTAFYTRLFDAIVMRSSTLNGLDSILYDGTMTAIQTNQNGGKAKVFGLSGSLKAQISRYVSFESNLTFTKGQLDDEDAPLDHIPPVYGMTAIYLKYQRVEGEFNVRYNGWKNLDTYSTSGEDNLPTATQWGTPSWYTLNVKAGYQINKYLKAQASLENILDQHYRLFASGVSSPGRNFIISLRCNF